GHVNALEKVRVELSPQLLSELHVLHDGVLKRYLVTVRRGKQHIKRNTNGCGDQTSDTVIALEAYAGPHLTHELIVHASGRNKRPAVTGNLTSLVVSTWLIRKPRCGKLRPQPRSTSHLGSDLPLCEGELVTRLEHLLVALCPELRRKDVGQSEDPA